MECELQSPEVLAAALQPIIYIVNESSVQEFQEFILPFIKNIFLMPKSVQVGVHFKKTFPIHTLLMLAPSDCFGAHSRTRSNFFY